MCTFYGVVDSRPDNRQTHEADARDDEVGRGPEGEDLMTHPGILRGSLNYLRVHLGFTM